MHSQKESESTIFTTSPLFFFIRLRGSFQLEIEIERASYRGEHISNLKRPSLASAKSDPFVSLALLSLVYYYAVRT